MGSFISELRRRNVFNVCAGYGVVGWLLMQLAGVLETSLHLPAWFDTATTVLVVIGFPIAVILSWIFQYTSTGLVRTERNPELSDKVHKQNTITIFTLMGIITIGLGGAIWMHLSTTPLVVEPATIVNTNAPPKAEATQTNLDTALSAASQSIAVLPFLDFSASEDQSYFGRGISEELLNVLSRVQGLRVVSRTSSFSFADKASTVGEIAKALQVAHVLEGSVRKSGSTVRITAQLINTQTDEHLWSQTYDRDLSAENLFAVQDEIAAAIVTQLKGKLTVLPIASSDKTLSIQAYELYLEARDNKNLRTPESLAAAEQGFTQVIDLDPSFAPAYAGLSDTYLLMDAYSDLSSEDSREKASPLIERALELAPDSAEVLAAAAYLASDQKTIKSMKAAETFARKAIEVNQNYANAYFLLAGILWEKGDLENAITNYKKARSLNPLSPIVLRNLASSYLYVNEYANAKSIAQDLLRLHPNLPYGASVLADLALKNGDYSEAHRLLLDAHQSNPNNEIINRKLARVYNFAGFFDEALKYRNDATAKVWHGIYTNDMATVASELPKVSDMADLGWFLYYLKDYEKTQQIVSGYIDAYQLLDRPIADSGSAKFILAYAHLQNVLGESSQQAIEMLRTYYASLSEETLQEGDVLYQQLLLASLLSDAQKSTDLLKVLIEKGQLVNFIDPIFGNVDEDATFIELQRKMLELRNMHQKEIQQQLDEQTSIQVLKL